MIFESEVENCGRLVCFFVRFFNNTTNVFERQQARFLGKSRAHDREKNNCQSFFLFPVRLYED